MSVCCEKQVRVVRRTNRSTTERVRGRMLNLLFCSPSSWSRAANYKFSAGRKPQAFIALTGSVPTVPASSLPHASVGISNKMKCLWSYSQIGTARGGAGFLLLSQPLCDGARWKILWNVLSRYWPHGSTEPNIECNLIEG